MNRDRRIWRRDSLPVSRDVESVYMYRVSPRARSLWNRVSFHSFRVFSAVRAIRKTNVSIRIERHRGRNWPDTFDVKKRSKHVSRVRPARPGHVGKHSNTPLPDTTVWKRVYLSPEPGRHPVFATTITVRGSRISVTKAVLVAYSREFVIT